MHTSGWKNWIKHYLAAASAEEPCTPDGGDSSKDSRADGHFCMKCGHVASTEAAHRAHGFRCYGYRNPLALRLDSARCPHCLVDFDSLLRVRLHVSQRPACRDMVEQLQILSPTKQAEADAQAASESRRARASGRSWGYGPPAKKCTAATVDPYATHPEQLTRAGAK